jgi:hypothetical protein
MQWMSGRCPQFTVYTIISIPIASSPAQQPIPPAIPPLHQPQLTLHPLPPPFWLPLSHQWRLLPEGLLHSQRHHLSRFLFLPSWVLHASQCVLNSIRPIHYPRHLPPLRIQTPHHDLPSPPPILIPMPIPHPLAFPIPAPPSHHVLQPWLQLPKEHQIVRPRSPPFPFPPQHLFIPRLDLKHPPWLRCENAAFVMYPA